jgi:serine/threonine-protein kinase RsbW
VLGGSAENLELVLPARPPSVAEARHALSAYAERCGWTDLWPIQTAVSEAVGNAVLHAYPDGSDCHRIWVRARPDDDGLLVAIEDEGTGMRPRVDSPGLGLGISLIESLADRLVMEDRSHGGLRVELWFEHEPGPLSSSV